MQQSHCDMHSSYSVPVTVHVLSLYALLRHVPAQHTSLYIIKTFQAASWQAANGSPQSLRIRSMLQYLMQCAAFGASDGWHAMMETFISTPTCLGACVPESVG